MSLVSSSGIRAGPTRPLRSRFEPRRRGHTGARRRLRFTPRLRLVVLAAIMLSGLGFGGWLWLRQSSLVAVQQVTIIGVGGSDASAIRAALRSAARNMTTLDVQLSRLRTAVAPFPEIKRLRVKTVFPHRMVIDVVEERAVAVVEVAGRRLSVAGDGTLLPTGAIDSSLPTIPVTVPPVGRRVTEGSAAAAVAVLGAAPYQLLSKISQVTTVAGSGLVAQLRSGPSIYFGDATHLAAKWLAATEVLADHGSAGASYIDVTDPGRPAAGAGSTASGASAGGTTASGATASASPSAQVTAPSGSSSATSGLASSSASSGG